MKPSWILGLTLCGTIFAMSMPVAFAGEDPDLATIISHSATALGYGDDFQALKNLSFATRTPSRDRVVEWQIVRPNLVRKVWDHGVVLVFDGQRAAFLAGPRDDTGELQPAHLVPAADWHHFEMDIALYVPAYFDHPAQYHGIVDFEGAAAHRISVALPMGGTAEYLVDVNSYLPIKISLPSWEYEVVPEDWSAIGGVMVYRFSRCTSHSNHNMNIEDIKVNAPIDKTRFAIPETIAASE